MHAQHHQQWLRTLQNKQKILEQPEPIVAGRLVRMVGLTLEAIPARAPIPG